MNEILTSQPGEVAVVNSDQFMPTVIRFQGFRPLRAVITRVGYSQSALANFMATLQNVIYVYTIGDDIGNLAVSGYAFSSVCNLAGNSHGISDVFREYDRMKLTNSNSTVVVTIGDKSLIGLLVGITIQSESPEFGLITYTLNIKVIPEETNLRKSVTQESDPGEERPPSEDGDGGTGRDSEEEVSYTTGTPSFTEPAGGLESYRPEEAGDNWNTSYGGTNNPFSASSYLEHDRFNPEEDGDEWDSNHTSDPMKNYASNTSGASSHSVALVNQAVLPNYGVV